MLDRRMAVMSRVQTVSLTSPSLEGNALGDPHVRQLRVYLPPSYDAQTSRHYPVAYFLHAFMGSGGGWSHASVYGTPMPERLDRVIARGSAPEMIGVFIDAETKMGGTQYVNSPAIGNYRDYVVKDVVPFVDAHYRTIPAAESRAVLGHSSGGYGAMVMARHHFDVFGHVVSHSGDSAFEYCYLHDFPKAAGAFLKSGGHEAWFNEFLRRVAETKMRGDDHPVLNTLAMAASYSPSEGSPLGTELPFDAATGRLRPSVWERWLAEDPVRFVPQNLASLGRLQSLFIDCGTRDEANLQWGTRMIAETLQKAGIEHLHEEFEDGHSGVSYRFERSLSYVGPRLHVR